jgi:hypothetical protein
MDMSFAAPLGTARPFRSIKARLSGPGIYVLILVESSMLGYLSFFSKCPYTYPQSSAV